MSKKLNLPRFDEQLLKFAHLRYKVVPILSETDPDGDREKFFADVQLPNTQTFVMREESFVETVIFPNGGVTAAFKIDPETSEADIGISKCNLSDVYIKNEGRIRAEGRFDKKRASPKNTHFETFFRLDISDVIEPEIPLSSTVRNCIINEVGDGRVHDIVSDMASIRAYIAFKTDIPFYVELS